MLFLVRQSFLPPLNNANFFFTFCSGVNISGPGRFRAKADNLDEQVCYFNAQNDNKLIIILTNTSYRHYKPKDFKNEPFVIDIYSFLLQNLNPLMTDRKFDNEND